jgi:hypothetical protein
MFLPTPNSEAIMACPAMSSSMVLHSASAQCEDRNRSPAGVVRWVLGLSLTLAIVAMIVAVL